VFTVEESRALRGDLVGGHVKNLFLRDKKRNLYLVTVEEDRPIDLKALRAPLDSRGTLSFGDAALLWAHLGVRPGSVTPLSAINDTAGLVRVALDKALLRHDTVFCHPLRNDRNTGLAPRDLLRFLEAVGHAPLLIDFDALPTGEGA
jgi:Ala-tRNA(Pro) deacylase